MSRERKLPAVPAISSKVPREIAQVLGPLKQIVEALQLGGIVSASSTTASGSSGAGSALPETVVEALIDSAIPPAPTGVAAQGGMALIIVSFDKPGYRNHAYTEVWRADSNDFSQAVLVGTTQSTVYTDSVGGSRVAWYWLRHVSTSTPPRIGPFNSQTGTRGETGQDATYVLDLVKGKLQDVHIAQVSAAKVMGSLKDWQIEALNASKIAGQLADAQLANISTAKLLGQIEMTQLAGAVQGNISSAIQTANQALTTANGAATATSVSQLSAKVDALSSNLLPVDLWKPGLAGLPAPWTNNWNNNTEQTLVSVAGPYGDVTTALKAVAKSGQADGGWDITVPIDKTKAYRFTVWIKDVSGNEGGIYLGINNVQNGGVDVSNPYFQVIPKTAVTNGSWILMVGYVFPYGSLVPAIAQSASYDGATGDVVLRGGDFTWSASATNAMPRCYQYYANEGAEQWFAYPRFEVIDGREPSISDLLSGTALTTSKAAITRVANVETQVAGKASVSDLNQLQARVATAEAGIVEANQARVDGDAVSASSINQVNARLAPGGDIYGALVGKAAQAALEATNTRVSTVETLANSKASASEFQQLSASVTGARREVFVPGDTNVFYPVALQATGRPNASTLTLRVSRPYVHQDGSWAGSYVADITARGSDWGNAPPALMSVFQRTGNGLATWGIGKVTPAQTTPHVILHLRGGLTHTIEIMGPPTSIGVSMPGSDGTLLLRSGVESYAKILQADAPLAAYLNKDWRPDGTLAKESVELFPQALNDISAQNTRLTTAEALIGTKAAATTVEALQARVGTAEASITTTSQAVATINGQVSGKWGVAIEATLPDGRKKLSGLQAFNDGSTATFAITADQLLVQSTGSALNADPAFTDRSAWQTNAGTWNTASITDGAVGTTALRSAPKAEIVGVRPQPFDPKKTYRIHGWARGAGGANGHLFLGLQLLDGAGQNISGNGSFWYTTISSVGTTWTEFNGTIGPSASLVSPATARSFRPIALVNYGGTAGYMELQDFRVEEVIPGTLIKPGEITTAHLVAQAVTAEKLAAYSVDVQHMRAGSVTADKLAVGAVTAASIQAGEIRTVHFAPQSITAEKIAAGSIGADKLAANAVVAGSIAAGAVSADKIQAGAVTADKLSVGSLSAISANIGTVTAGTLRNTAWTSFVDLNAVGTAPFISTAGGFVVNADGSGSIDSRIIGNVVTGQASIGIRHIGSSETGYYEYDTVTVVHGRGRPVLPALWLASGHHNTPRIVWNDSNSIGISVLGSSTGTSVIGFAYI